MTLNEILSKCDHTLLSVNATWEEIKAICDDGIKYQTASVCIPASYVKQAAEYAAGRVKICTVIGFPNGYDTTAAKAFMAADAVKNGADEIDMVINLGMLKSGDYSGVLEDICAVRKVTEGKVLKVIIETCLLTREEKIKMCEIVSESGADYIKTSTGFSTGGATFEDVSLMKEHVAEGVKVKAAGGIKTLDDAEKFVSLGADRLGTSRIVKLAKQAENR
ncbi:MAG: deoxyribose-phosphate aldolase [Lachnospiraceae bacterium]